MLEALTLDPAEQSLGRHREAVEGDLVFLHTAITEDRDFGPGHPLGRKRVGIAAPRLGARNMLSPR